MKYLPVFIINCFLIIALNVFDFACQANIRHQEYIIQPLKDKGIYWGISSNKAKEIFNANDLGWNIEDAISTDSCSDLKIVYFSSADNRLVAVL